MRLIKEDAEFATVELSLLELVGLSNSVLMMKTFHADEIHTLTALWLEEAQQIIDELAPIIERVRDAREAAGLPRTLP